MIGVPYSSPTGQGSPAVRRRSNVPWVRPHAGRRKHPRGVAQVREV